MTFLEISSKGIAKCPAMSLNPRHYRKDGSCHCSLEEDDIFDADCDDNNCKRCHNCYMLYLDEKGDG